MFNRFRAFCTKGYQRGSLGKDHQNGVYLKQAIRKSYPLIACCRSSRGSSLGFRAVAFRPESTQTIKCNKFAKML